MGELWKSFKQGWKWAAKFDRPGPRPALSRMRSGKAVDEARETAALYAEVQSLWDASTLAGADPHDFVIGVLKDVVKQIGKMPRPDIVDALFNVVEALMVEDGLWDTAEVDLEKELTLEEGVILRKYLYHQRRVLQNLDDYQAIWRRKLVIVLSCTLEQFPDLAFSDIDDDEPDDERVSLRMSLVDVVRDPATCVERLISTFFDEDVKARELFGTLREQCFDNTLVATGLQPGLRYDSEIKKPLVFPTQYKFATPGELIETYLRHTPFFGLLNLSIPAEFPEAIRFEHCHIVGGTGHGKTQVLQFLIHDDLERVRRGEASIVVIDSQGDLIRTISHLAGFAPDGDLADRILLIDPNDVEHPVALNMFDVNMEGLEGCTALDRERILNGTIELYEYLFGALLGAELTQKQGVIFRYLARLMLAIPEATIHTLMDLMENGKPYRKYMEALPGTARMFFEREFFHPSFAATKKQILRRLWGVLSNQTFERMFSHPRNKVDVFKEINSGKIILINTAKDLLKQEGCEIFGRFFIAMISQAAVQRQIIPAEERLPTFVYVDEAYDYFDENIGNLLNQARKYRVGVTLAHQNLGQLSSQLRSSVMASTSIKLAGGVSAKDATELAKEMRTTGEFIQNAEKRDDETEFACWIKNATGSAIKLSVPLGYVDEQPTVTEAEYEALLESNRQRYCVTVEEIDAILETHRDAHRVEQDAPEEPKPRRAPESQAEGPVHSTEEASTVGEEPTERERVVQRPETAASIEQRPEVIPRPEELTPTTPRPRRPIEPPELPAMGRGGRRHKYIQQLVKKTAESEGFRAVIEHQLPDGSGSVDIALIRDDLKVACEISISTNPEHELGNVEKCLAADFDMVIAIAESTSSLTKLRKLVGESTTGTDAEKVVYLLPEDAVAHIQELTAPSPRETTVRGYKVNVRRKPTAPEDASSRRRAIGEILAKSSKRLKDD